MYRFPDEMQIADNMEFMKTSKAYQQFESFSSACKQ